MPFTARLYDGPAPATDVPRNRTHLTARLSHAASELHHIVVHNLSSQGVLIESYHPLQIGAGVALDLDALGEITARIVWREGLFYDCLFDVPIAAESVARLTKAKILWGNFPSHRTPKGNSARPVTFGLEGTRLAVASDGRLLPRARLAWIVGAAILCWAIPIGIVLLLIR